MRYDLGYVDLEEKTLQPLDNVTYLSRPDIEETGAPGGIRTHDLRLK